MRLRGRTDANQKALRTHAEALGASFVSLANLGEGCSDAMLGWRGETFLVEFKTEKGYLTEQQRQFNRRWQGGKVHVVRTEADLERLLLGKTL